MKSHLALSIADLINIMKVWGTLKYIYPVASQKQSFKKKFLQKIFITDISLCDLVEAAGTETGFKYVT